ncbi:DUF7093 family protein [Natronorubrum halophilum]|uniref:DUF7093 family protein n=1 Tax=Natronorubrum halophilum TaxID=1702106 RepID=UPI000EF6E0CE|nr:hypothetical protein [Natronorubrum halophilum]
MVLRCSLLGHDYGDAEVDREREERGSEVVVTVQEYEECVRCGERNVISENTEVTSISVAADADSLPDESELESDTTASVDTEPAEPPADAPVETGTEIEFTDEAGGAELVDADSAGDESAPDDPVSADAQSPDSDDGIDVPTDENGEPITDDAEILEDDDDETPRDREHGEWPDSEDVGPPVGTENDPSEWPDDEQSDIDEAATAIDAEPPADTEVVDDGEILEDDTTLGSAASESTAAADARSVTTEAPTPPNAGSEADAEREADAGSGIERAAAAPAPGESGDASREDVPTEFYCPRCDYVASSDRASLRAGDICPECRKGYLGEREYR